MDRKICLSKSATKHMLPVSGKKTKGMKLLQKIFSENISSRIARKGLGPLIPSTANSFLSYLGRSCNLSPYRAKFWITVSHLLESRAARRKYSFSTAGLSQNAEVFLKRKLIIRRTPDSMIPLPHIKLPAL